MSDQWREERRNHEPQKQEDAKESKYGDWMLAKRHRRRLVKNPGENGRNHPAVEVNKWPRGSRFDPLANFTENHVITASLATLPLAYSQTTVSDDGRCKLSGEGGIM